MAALGVMVGLNATLRTLGLAHNGIGDKGTVHLAKGLKNNIRLNTLQLGANKISDDGCKHIAAAVMHNRALVTLGLSGNPIGSIGRSTLAEALRDNVVIRNVVIGGMNIVVNNYAANILTGKPVGAQHWADPAVLKEGAMTASPRTGDRSSRAMSQGQSILRLVAGNSDAFKLSHSSFLERERNVVDSAGEQELSPRWEPTARTKAATPATGSAESDARRAARNACVLCGNVIEGKGFDPRPILESGRCCESCHGSFVKAAQIAALGDLTPRVARGRRGATVTKDFAQASSAAAADAPM